MSKSTQWGNRVCETCGGWDDSCVCHLSAKKPASRGKPNAREFLDEIAETLRAQGRTVTVDVEDHDWGTFVWLSSIGPHFPDATITLSAAYSGRTKRWSLGELKVSRTLSADVVKKTRTEIRIATATYGPLA